MNTAISSIRSAPATAAQPNAAAKGGASEGSFETALDASFGGAHSVGSPALAPGAQKGNASPSGSRPAKKDDSSEARGAGAGAREQTDAAMNLTMLVAPIAASVTTLTTAPMIAPGAAPVEGAPLEATAPGPGGQGSGGGAASVAAAGVGLAVGPELRAGIVAAAEPASPAMPLRAARAGAGEAVSRGQSDGVKPASLAREDGGKARLAGSDFGKAALAGLDARKAALAGPDAGKALLTANGGTQGTDVEPGTGAQSAHAKLQQAAAVKTTSTGLIAAETIPSGMTQAIVPAAAQTRDGNALPDAAGGFPAPGAAGSPVPETVAAPAPSGPVGAHGAVRFGAAAQPGVSGPATASHAVSGPGVLPGTGHATATAHSAGNGSKENAKNGDSQAPRQGEGNATSAGAGDSSGSTPVVHTALGASAHAASAGGNLAFAPPIRSGEGAGGATAFVSAKATGLLGGDAKGTGPAATPDALPASVPGPVNTARVLASMGGTEMRVGMHSAEFGSISIATSVSQGGVQAQILLDHGALGKALTEHLPGIEEKLGSALGVTARVEVRDGFAGALSQGGSGGSGSGGFGSGEGSAQGGRQGRNGDVFPAPQQFFQAERGMAVAGETVFARAGDGARLSVRA